MVPEALLVRLMVLPDAVAVAQPPPVMALARRDAMVLEVSPEPNET